MTTIPVQKRRPRTEESIDETIDDSFPASDPPSYSRTARAGAPSRGANLNKVTPQDEHAPEDKDVPKKEDKEK